MVGSKYVALVVAAFIAGAFIASPELRAYAAATITSEDIVDSTVRSIDIKDGEVKASDIATGAVGSHDIFDESVKSNDIAEDAIGASELKGVSKLVFKHCTNTGSNSIAPGGGMTMGCIVEEAFPGDDVVASIIESPNGCFVLDMVGIGNQRVAMNMVNACETSVVPGTMEFSIILYKIS